MRVIIVALGSMGDLLPFMAIGMTLHQNGHHVTMLAPSWDEQLMLGAGLEVSPIIDEKMGQQLFEHPDLFHYGKRQQVLENHFFFPAMAPTFEFIQNESKLQDVVLVGPPWAFGARLAQEKFELPLVTVLLAPWSLVENGRDPAPLKSERYEPLHQMRQQQKLPSMSEPLLSWRLSSSHIAGLFPKWFVDERGWPKRIPLTNFSPFDGTTDNQLDPQLQEFLAKGDPPLIFTPGTKITKGKRFFDESVKVCQLLNKRAIFLSLHPDQVPDSLPDTVQFYEYVPLRALLPHAEAIVYHGGIGTCAHVLRAGIPHVTMPMVYDQFDNSDRIEALGVGDQISVEKYYGSSVANQLEQLLSSPIVSKNCQEIAQNLEGKNGIQEVCRIIEKI